MTPQDWSNVLRSVPDRPFSSSLDFDVIRENRSCCAWSDRSPIQDVCSGYSLILWIHWVCTSFSGLARNAPSDRLAQAACAVSQSMCLEICRYSTCVFSHRTHWFSVESCQRKKNQEYYTGTQARPERLWHNWFPNKSPNQLMRVTHASQWAIKSTLQYLSFFFRAYSTPEQLGPVRSKQKI